MPRPHAMPEIRTTLAAAAATSGSRAIAAFGGGTFAGGPTRTPSGSTRSSVSSRRSGGNSWLMRRGSPTPEPSGEAPTVPAGRGARRRRPRENEARRRAEQHARDGVQGAQARDHAQRRAQGHPEKLREARQERPAQDGAAESDERRVGRSRPRAGSARCAPHVGAEREPGERQGSADEPLREPVQPEEQDDAEHDPVRRRHGRRLRCKEPLPLEARLH